MSLSTVRTEIKTILEALDGIENVYDYKRYCKDWKTYKNLFKKGYQINTWEITRPSFEYIVHGSDSCQRKTHNFLIRGFRALDDSLASEKTFQDLVEIVANSFRDKPKLNNTAEVVNVPIVGRTFEDFLGSVLCHVCEIEVNIREREVF